MKTIHCSWLVPLALAAAITPAFAGSTFTIVALPDTQYYTGSNNWALVDQMNWIKANAAALNIQMVVGLGDITDNGGGTGCATALPPENSAAMWSNADSDYKILDAAGIPYMAAIGNHDYDCHNDRPVPRMASNFNHYFGPSRYTSKSWFTAGAHGWYNATSSENFYTTKTINGINYLFLALEFYPRDNVLSWANAVVSNHPNSEVVMFMHSYMNYDGSTPGTAPRMCNGMSDSAASYYGTNYSGLANNGCDMWNKLVNLHPNIRTVFSGHVRLPSPGDNPPNNNGVGYRSDVNSTGHRVNQFLSDYQGQGANGYFGKGYLRIYTFDQANHTLSVKTYSPAAASSVDRAKFPSPGAPANPWRTDGFNQFTVAYEPLGSASPGPSPSPTSTSSATVTISAPAAGSTVTSPVLVKSTCTTSAAVDHQEVWDNGKKLGNVPGKIVNQTFAMPAGATRLTIRCNNGSTIVGSSVENFTVN